MDSMNFLSAKFVLMAAVVFFFFAYWVFNFVILYHLTRFGIGVQPKKFAAIFLLGSVGLFFISVLLFADINMENLRGRANMLATNLFNVTENK